MSAREEAKLDRYDMAEWGMFKNEDGEWVSWDAAQAAIVAAERRALERAAKVADDFRDVMLNTDLQTEPLLWLDGAEHAARDVAAAIRALAGEEGT